ncbi:hypothetical protein HZS80_09875 [Halomonas glaciei]|uniref:Lipoprotein n=2 Tax=Vreelandella TaxID=3137766 RepID=A0A7Z0RY93_9GAMM|nr:hypothetical protein [Halomonas glaciei]NYS78016.1 hypothetical protein [Halomonas glaciei]|tara:strand:+ start:324 stop:1004 length:681 start_codon:yes stop_codon:yes gene_type:complete
MASENKFPKFFMFFRILKAISFLMLVGATGCTHDGLIHPSVLGIAAGVASVKNPDFDLEAFNRSTDQYYGRSGSGLQQANSNGSVGQQSGKAPITFVTEQCISIRQARQVPGVDEQAREFVNKCSFPVIVAHCFVNQRSSDFRGCKSYSLTQMVKNSYDAITGTRVHPKGISTYDWNYAVVHIKASSATSFLDPDVSLFDNNQGSLRYVAFRCPTGRIDHRDLCAT